MNKSSQDLALIRKLFTGCSEKNLNSLDSRSSRLSSRLSTRRKKRKQLSKSKIEMVENIQGKNDEGVPGMMDENSYDLAGSFF